MGNLLKRGREDGNSESSDGCVDGKFESGNFSKRGCVDGDFESGNLSKRGCEDGNFESGNLSINRCRDGNLESGNLSNSGGGLNQLRNEGECVSSLGNVVGDKLEEMKDEEEQHDESNVCCFNEDGGVVEGKKSEFCYGEKERERFNRVLRYYEGTHNFHNFTSRITAQDPSAKRYIVSFSANTTVTVDGIEFVKCEVVGQSFLLHQIRKMIGLAVVIMRGIAPETLIQTAFRKDVKINVPVAPEVGLYLDECFFTPYNKKWKDSHEEVSMKGYTKEAEDFKSKYIYPHIASTERKEGTVALWLHYLNHHNYPDLRIGACTGEEKAEPQDLLARSNNGSSSVLNIEVENECLRLNGSSGGNSSAENSVVKDVNDGENDAQNVEVKDTDQ
ncbi:hypothetical protein Leryth_022938 [Lithospermum erythrorhizon]|nr:hypothetical protein Leryth_022938 [Lithospermum erythrorhizon]